VRRVLVAPVGVLEGAALLDDEHALARLVDALQLARAQRLESRTAPAQLDFGAGEGIIGR
jgi:hypothetical protein